LQKSNVFSRKKMEEPAPGMEVADPEEPGFLEKETALQREALLSGRISCPWSHCTSL
jgi:hypothetical protein